VGVRDFLLNEALKRLAGEASACFSVLVAGGEQIPFDVAEQPGPDSFFHSYQPRTERFVHDHEEELRALPAFEATRAAVEEAGVAVTYLEERGEIVPVEPGERAAKMVVVFIASLWEGCTGFSLDRERLDGALALLDAEALDADEADVLVAPVVGLRMSCPSLQLPHGVRLIRADAIEAPLEAMRSEGMGRAAWEPQFLALAEQGEDSESAEEAMAQLHELISVMRLFKAGGIGLGPYAFAPTGEGRWQRIPTGAAATRPGGYRLSEDEASQLAEFATRLEARPDPDRALSWAVSRFEMGCARETALEGLSDHLLALRAVLDGHGPVGASLPMRAAALIADESLDRVETRERIEQAQELERAQMNGARVEGALHLAGWVEAGARRLLGEAALGELGTDLGTVADETLIVAGLEAGDVSIAVAEDTSTANEIVEDTVYEEEVEMDEETRILEPIPAEDEIKITATNWLEEVEESTLDFPAIEGDVSHRERIDTPRVRHLFPVPEDADWEVRELDYDHYRHAG
jgi:hypothetical protein